MKDRPENKKSRAKVEQLHASKDLSAKDLKKLRGGHTSGDDHGKYLVIKLQEVQVSSVTQGSGGSDGSSVK